MNHPLQYLLFDASDDGHGTGTWEAMASARAADPMALAEVQQVPAVAVRDDLLTEPLLHACQLKVKVAAAV